MTASEKRAVRLAVEMLMQNDGDFHGAIEILRNLIGEDHPPARLTRKLKPVDFRKVAAGPSRPFQASDDKREMSS